MLSLFSYGVANANCTEQLLCQTVSQSDPHLSFLKRLRIELHHKESRTISYCLFRNCRLVKKNVLPHSTVFTELEKCCARSKSELNYKNIQKLSPQMLAGGRPIQNPKHHPDT